MPKIELTCENLGKKYSEKTIFAGLSFKLENKSSLAITGKNGTGKSTLIKIIANLIRETKGKYTIRLDEKEVLRENFYNFTGLLAPYLMMYDELTGYENLEFFYGLKVDRKENPREEIKYLLKEVNLFTRGNDFVKNYSSGMKQRLKLAFAIINNPLILLLDEPRTNLDNEGIEVVYKISERQRNKGILIVATNESDDTKLCSEIINIEDYKDINI